MFKSDLLWLAPTDDAIGAGHRRFALDRGEHSQDPDPGEVDVEALQEVMNVADVASFL